MLIGGFFYLNWYTLLDYKKVLLVSRWSLLLLSDLFSCLKYKYAKVKASYSFLLLNEMCFKDLKD